MRYKQALETIEEWLEDKKIRIFCRSACGGRCCIPHEPHCIKRCERPPLLCSMYLCDEIRKIIFGFHNGEKYQDIYHKINRIIADAGYDPMKLMDPEINLNIPDKLINALIHIKYEDDIHIFSK